MKTTYWTIGRGAFSVAKGKTQTVDVTVDSDALALFVTAKRHAVRVTLTSTCDGTKVTKPLEIS